MTTESLREMKEIGRPVIQEIRSKLSDYLKLAEIAPKTGLHLSEYTGYQMLNQISRYVLDRYFALAASGGIDAGHGYDDNVITREIKRELREVTGAAQVEIVPTGTAANLCLIASFTKSYGTDLKFVACSTEHTIDLEADMLEYAGIKAKNKIILPSRDKGDGIIDIAILRDALPTEVKFIFQMAIPSNEGVVPSMEELIEIIKCVKDRGGIVLIDGARLTNALVHWGKDISSLKELGIDGFTLGTSKKGGVAEVVGIYDNNAAEKLHSVAKSLGHIHSKLAPFALVTGIFLGTGLWKQEAKSENDSAKLFAQICSKLGIEPVYKVCSNMVFYRFSSDILKKLEQDPRFGITYNDYDRSKDVTRMIFTAFRSRKSILETVRVLATAYGKSDEEITQIISG